MNLHSLLLEREMQNRPVTVGDTTADAGVQSVLIEPLSHRELEVLRMLDLGCSNKGIGERLFISENTVKVHLRNVNAKLAVGSRTQAVSAAQQSEIERFKRELLDTRTQLRDVQHNLRKDIDWLGTIPKHWEVWPLKRYLAQSLYGVSAALEPTGVIS